MYIVYNPFTLSLNISFKMSFINCSDYHRHPVPNGDSYCDRRRSCRCQKQSLGLSMKPARSISSDRHCQNGLPLSGVWSKSNLPGGGGGGGSGRSNKQHTHRKKKKKKKKKQQTNK